MGMFTMAYVRMATEISRVYRHFDAIDHTTGRVYRQKTCVCEHGRPCGQQHQNAIYTAGRVYSHFDSNFTNEVPILEKENEFSIPNIFRLLLLPMLRVRVPVL